MDKLKQVLKYQFWILLGLAVLLPLVGWFLASAGLAKGYEEREKKLSSRFNELKASVADPNADWENRLKQVNTVQELEARKVWVALWEAQQPLKTWPAKLSTNDPTKFTNADLGFYRKNYMQLREEVYEKLQPVVDSEEEGKPPQGLVSLALADFPISPSESLAGSSTTPPSPQDVEEAQEDLWLAEALIQVVNYLNRDATSQLDAAIPEVRVIQLRGGNRADGKAKSTPKNSGGGGGGGTSGAASMGEMMAGGMKDMIEKGKGQSGMGGAGGGGGQANTTIGAIPQVSFNADEELGEEGDKPKRRYVEERDEWRTRGFYLEVKINQTRVPELLVALSSLQWPARVSRVHVADVREEELIPAGSAGSNAGMMAGGGAGAPGMAGGMAGMAGGGAAAMKGMGEALSKGMSKGGGGGMGAGVGGTMISRTKPAAAGGGGGLPGADAGGTGASTQKRDGIDPLNNPNLVNLALDGWFTIFKKPKPEVLALVYPPATETPAGTATPGVPAPAATSPGASAPGASAPGASAPGATVPAAQGTPVGVNTPAAGTPAAGTPAVANPAAATTESTAPAEGAPTESDPAPANDTPDEPTTPAGEAPGEAPGEPNPESATPPAEPAPSAGGQP